MSVTKNFSWALSGSGWAINYDATVTVSVSRAYGSDIARITASGSMHTPAGNGDSNAKWIFQLKCGSSTWNKTISSGYHAPGRRDSFTYTFDINVGAESGSLSGRVDFQAYDNNNGFGAWAGEQTWSQSYGSKGASTIASATNVTLDLNGLGSDQPTSTVTWTSYSSSFTYRLHASCNGMTYYRNYSPATSGTVTANFGFGSDWIDYITNGKSATCTFTLTTYSGGSSIGSTTKNITLYVPSSGINPTVAIATEKVSALQNTYFANKYCTLIDKLKVTLTETIFKWDQSKSGSPIASRSIVANGENFTASPATTTNPLSTSGVNTISASVTDGRGNSGSNTASVDVYWYFYPTVSVKYRHGSNYYLDISGRIAYVGGDQTTKTLRLAIYKGSTLIVDNLNLDSYIASTPSGGTYDGYLEINGAYAIPDEYISDISIDTYEFRLTVSDTVSSATALAYSGIAVMTFGAGGTDITTHKPITFESGIQPMDSNGITGVEILPTRLGDELGGRIKLDRGVSTARDAYIDTYDSKLRFIDRNPSTAIRASLDLTNGNFDAGGYQKNGTQVYPPTILRGSISGGSGTTYWRVLEYCEELESELWATMSCSAPITNSYGNLYFANLTMMLPYQFYNSGGANPHYICTAWASSGLLSCNIHDVTGSGNTNRTVKIYVSNSVSGTITVNIELRATKW